MGSLTPACPKITPRAANTLNTNKEQRMKAVIQRVSSASVSVDSTIVSSIQKGLMILLGISENDTERDKDILVNKIAKLRIFADDADKMNRAITDVQGEILLVSQFTLCADCRHGNRPSFVTAMKPDQANALYQAFGKDLENRGIPVKYGVFGAMMDVALINDGPVTIILESQNGAILS